MKITILIIFFILGLQCEGGVHSESSNAEVWSRFLQVPTNDNLDKLTDQIGPHSDKCDWGAPENEIAVPAEFRRRFFAKIASGNEASLRIGLYVVRCFDGGDLEDFYESAGKFFDKNPEAFLREAKRLSVPTARYVRMLLNLPETLVDNSKAQRQAINHRIRLLEEIDTPEFEELKKVGVGVLTKQKNRYQ